MAYLPAAASLVSGILGDITGNAQNKANLVNQQNANTSAGRDIWNSSQMVEQLLKQLTGGGQISAPSQYGGGQTLGGGIMGTGGQFQTPQAGQGQGSQGQLPPQLLQMLQQFMGGNRGPIVPGQGAPNVPGQMHPGMAPSGPTSPATGSNPWEGTQTQGAGTNSLLGPRF